MTRQEQKLKRLEFKLSEEKKKVEYLKDEIVKRNELSRRHLEMMQYWRTEFEINVETLEKMNRHYIDPRVYGLTKWGASKILRNYKIGKLTDKIN